MTDPAIVEGSSEPAEETLTGGPTRKEKRKALKKLKRKQIRKEVASKEREEEEALINDPEEQLRIRLREQEESETLDRERKAFEERERLLIESAAARKAEEEAQREKLLEELQRSKVEQADQLEEGDDWEYVEDGPAEIIWKGNEIIVKKKRVKVPKKSTDQQPNKEDDDRPTSNPLPPQSAAFASCQNGPSISAREMLENVAQQIPNFGTEQDKAHCPFHLKTGTCRFGSRCSRVHFHPDKSCTLLIKNMYNGPGLAWEQDEGLEYTDEEVDRSYEEFYEDVHTEFLKFGELVNFKVCRNGLYHLRGNVYVHYKSLESAILTYNNINGRYFAGKQITCEFVGVTRWKVAICGEYMKSRLRTCSRGTACNFIHCFRNPGGDYEWADWDNPPPRHWIRKMAVLFGPSDESGYEKQTEQGDFDWPRDSSRMRTPINKRYQPKRSTYREMDVQNGGFGMEVSNEKKDQRSSRSRSHRREHSSRSRKGMSPHHKHEKSEENSGEDGSKEKERDFLKKHRKSVEKNSSEDHERRKRRYRTRADSTSREKAFSDEQEKSEKRYKSKTHVRYGVDRYSDYSDDNIDRRDSHSGERPYCGIDARDRYTERYSHSYGSIDAHDRYNERYCSNELGSDGESSLENRSVHNHCPDERRKFDRHNSPHYTKHTSDDPEQDESKFRKEDIDQKSSSDESFGSWRKRNRGRDHLLPNESGRSCKRIELEESGKSLENVENIQHKQHSKHSRSGRKRKSYREKKKYEDINEESTNSDSDNLELIKRACKEHARSRTPVPFRQLEEGEKSQK